MKNERLQRHKNTKLKIFVGMSGGVDSSVSAALLKIATPNNFEKLFGRPTPEGFFGYDVVGVFIKVWQPDFLPLDSARGKECQTDDRREAMRAAAHLKIPFLTFDFESEYKKEVVDYMVREYKAGRTPNPDVMCNQRIKFGKFFEKARKLGADYIATGHYARKREIKNKRSKIKNYQLLVGKDKNKDQSYFLWTLTQDQLKHIIFPVGGYTKPEVRTLARKFGLPNAERTESQGLCFVGEFKLKDFLGHFISAKRGNVTTSEGEVIGYHDGAFYYTLGQRHGFTVTKKTPNEPPYYIVGKDVKKNVLIVSHKGSRMRGVEEVVIRGHNFISGETLDEKKMYKVRFRYRQPLVNAKIKKKKSELVVHFEKPQTAVTPGQSLVIYRKEVCIGGGIIV